MSGPDLTEFSAEQFDPHAPEYSANPYPFYAWFRAHAPVAWVGPPYDCNWAFAYEDVLGLVQNDDLWSKQDAVAAPGFRVLDNLPTSIFGSDNPFHDKVRKEIQPLFRKAIAGAGAAARDAGQALLAQAAARSRFDLIEAFALPLPMQILRQVLGVSATDWPLVTTWVEMFAAGNDPTSPPGLQFGHGTAAAALTTFYAALFRDGPYQPDAGGLLAAMQAHKSRVLTADVATSNAVSLSIAGYLSTTFLIGTGSLNLLRTGGFAKLRARPDLLESAVWEMLRFDSPFQLVDRWAKRDTTLGGRRIAKGEKVTGAIGSANRDPKVFKRPDVFDIERFVDAGARSKVLSFGDGIHRCLGEPLLQQTAPAAFASLLHALPPFELAGTPQWQTDPVLRAVVNLPIALSA